MSVAFRVTERKGLRDLDILPMIFPDEKNDDDVQCWEFDKLAEARRQYERIAVYGVYTTSGSPGRLENMLFIQQKSLDIIEWVEQKDGTLDDHIVDVIDCQTPTQEDIDAGRIRL